MCVSNRVKVKRSDLYLTRSNKIFQDIFIFWEIHSNLPISLQILRDLFIVQEIQIFEDLTSFTKMFIEFFEFS